MRPKSLYQEGMLPRFKRTDQAWRIDSMVTTEVKFKTQEKQLSQLSFVYTIQEDNETVSFAYDTPYTYSDLNLYLQPIKKDKRLKQILRINALCRTIGGNKCEIMTITSNVSKVMNMF